MGPTVINQWLPLEERNATKQGELLNHKWRVVKQGSKELALRVDLARHPGFLFATHSTGIVHSGWTEACCMYVLPPLRGPRPVLNTSRTSFGFIWV